MSGLVSMASHTTDSTVDKKLEEGVGRTVAVTDSPLAVISEEDGDEGAKLAGDVAMSGFTEEEEAAVRRKVFIRVRPLPLPPRRPLPPARQLLSLSALELTYRARARFDYRLFHSLRPSISHSFLTRWAAPSRAVEDEHELTSSSRRARSTTRPSWAFPSRPKACSGTWQSPPSTSCVQLVADRPRLPT